MRTALLAITLVACSASPEPYEWPERVRLSFAPDFTEEERAELDAAVSMWNRALGDEVVIESAAGEHWVIDHCGDSAAGVYGPDIGLCLERLHEEYEPEGVDMTTVMAHELGHVLIGTESHLDSGLMHWEAEHRSWAEVDDAARVAACEVWCVRD